MGERVTDERLAMLLDANGIPSESKEGRALSTGIMLDLRDCRAALAEAQGQVAALRADLIAQIGPDYDCPACDRGVLRQRVDGREPEHWDDCPAARAVATLLDTAAAATAHDERVRSEERERCAKVAEATSMEFAYAGSRADELARVIAAAIRALSPGTADAEKGEA